MVRTARFSWSPDEEPDLSELRDDMQGDDMQALDDAVFADPPAPAVPSRKRRRGRRPAEQSLGPAGSDGKKMPGPAKPNPVDSQHGPARRKKGRGADRRHLAGADWLVNPRLRTPRRRG